MQLLPFFRRTMRHGYPIREGGLVLRIEFQIRDVNQIEAGSGLSIADLFSAFGLQVESIPESLPDTLEWFAIDRPNRSLHLMMLNRLEALNVRIALYPEERS